MDRVSRNRKADANTISARGAFTLVELLVVIAIIAILVGLLLPAVQMAREAARRMQCTNSLKQIALAMHNYENSNKAFPPCYYRPASGVGHNMLTLILPYIEQQAVYDRIDFKKDFEDNSVVTAPAVNNNTATQVNIAAFVCPTAPRSRKWVADYACDTLFHSDAYTPLKTAGKIKDRSDWTSIIQSTATAVSDVRDGLSNSILLFEDAGRPLGFSKTSAGLVQDSTSISGDRWADDEAPYNTHNVCGTSAINCNNHNETFSFHTGGAMFAFGDGSITFLSDSTDPEVYVSLFTKSAGDIATR